MYREKKLQFAPVIVVTHDEKIVSNFKRLYNIRDGRTIEERARGNQCSPAAALQPKLTMCELLAMSSSRWTRLDQAVSLAFEIEHVTLRTVRVPFTCAAAPAP